MQRAFTLFLSLFLVLCASVLTLHAADPKPVKCKVLLSDAKAALKTAKVADIQNAEKRLVEALGREDLSAPQKADLCFTAAEMQKGLNDIENKKLYLHQSYDTIRFFSSIQALYAHILRCDSFDNLPVGGVVKPRYRSKNRVMLKGYQTNLLNGGKFLLKRNDFAQAYPYFDIYVKAMQSPVLSAPDDPQLPRVAYWATISAYNAQQPLGALAHIDQAIARADSSLAVSLQEYKVRCLDNLGWKQEWMNNLVLGTQLYPQHDYFFRNLIDYYAENRQYDDGIALCDDMLSRVGSQSIYWFGKSQMYLAKQDYDACIEASEEALQQDSTLADAYYNKGISCYNKAILFAPTVCSDIRNPKCRDDRQHLMQLYRDALQPMEQYRRLVPSDEARWASPLYQIYLNLNMGREFSEMERILNAKK